MEIKYGLMVTKGKNKTINVEDDLVGLKELDGITRQYCGKKEVIDLLKSQGKLPKNVNGSWTLKLVRGRNRHDCKMLPLYNEKYTTQNEDSIYEQILDFAEQIYKIYVENAVKHTDEHENVYYRVPYDTEVRDKIYNSMKSMKGLRNPKFYKFSRDYFLKNIYMKNIEGDRILLKFNGIAEFDKQCNEEKSLSVNKKVFVDFYNDLLWGFYKIFCSESSRGIELNYLNIRKYYTKYYNKFIKPLAKKQNEEKANLNKQLKLKDFIPDQFTSTRKSKVTSQAKVYTTWEEDESLYNSISAEEYTKTK